MEPPEAAPRGHVAQTRDWQQRLHRLLSGAAGRRATSKFLARGSCHDIAMVARRLEKLARLEDDESLDKATDELPEVTARFAKKIIVTYLKQATGVNSVKNIVAVLRLAGVLQCALNKTLPSCACLADLRNSALRQQLNGTIADLSADLNE